MFFQVYKSTVKNIIRSLLFWASLAVVIFLVIQSSIEGIWGGDDDPTFIITYDKYIQIVLNSLRAWIMFYALPIIPVITTVLVLNRDYGDGFFEIEKAEGVSTPCYFFGRLSALVSVNIILGIALSLLSFNLYYFTRGGVADFTLFSYICDSTIRILRCFFCAELPGILVYLGTTYIVGSLLKNGFAGGVAGLGYLLITYLFNYQLRFRMSQFYLDYIDPISIKLYSFWTFYDTEWFTNKLNNPFTGSQLALCMGILLGTAVVCFAVSYICTHRRKI